MTCQSRPTNRYMSHGPDREDWNFFFLKMATQCGIGIKSGETCEGKELFMCECNQGCCALTCERHSRTCSQCNRTVIFGHGCDCNNLPVERWNVFEDSGEMLDDDARDDTEMSGVFGDNNICQICGGVNENDGQYCSSCY